MVEMSRVGIKKAEGIALRIHAKSINIESRAAK